MGMDMGRPASLIALFFLFLFSRHCYLQQHYRDHGTRMHVRGHIASDLFCLPFADTAAPLNTLLFTHTHTHTHTRTHAGRLPFYPLAREKQQ